MYCIKHRLRADGDGGQRYAQPESRIWKQAQDIQNAQRFDSGGSRRALNLDRSTYTYYEKGRVPNLDTLNKLSKIFNVSVAELIGERDDGALDVIKNASRELHVESIFLRPDEKQLILNLRLCSPVERQKIFYKVNQYIERKSK